MKAQGHMTGRPRKDSMLLRYCPCQGHIPQALHSHFTHTALCCHHSGTISWCLRVWEPDLVTELYRVSTNTSLPCLTSSLVRSTSLGSFTRIRLVTMRESYGYICREDTTGLSQRQKPLGRPKGKLGYIRVWAVDTHIS